MEKKKVINFEQNDEFYFKIGKSQLERGEYFQAIKNLQQAIKLLKSKNEFLLSSYHLVLAQTYAFLGMHDLSNYYYFLSLSNELFSQIAFRGLGENFYLQEDYILSRFYLNKCINLLEDNELSMSAKKIIEIIDKKTHKGFRVIKSQIEIERENEILKAHQMMAKGAFSEAISIFESNNVGEDKNLRAELSLAYFFVGETEKGIEIIDKHQNENSLLDLCNLYLIYSLEKQNEKKLDIKRRLLNFKIENEEDNFKIGLAFAQTGELEDAKKHMKKFFSKAKSSLELKFLYMLTCLNNQDFDEARDEILNFKTINPFGNYIYDYYLNLCSEKKKVKLDYIFGLPVKEFLKVKSYVKNCLLLSDEDLRNEFLKNKDLFYYIANFQESNLKDLFLTKLSKIQCEDLNDFFNYVLIKTNLRNDIKNKIAYERIKQDDVNIISLAKDNVYSKIILPNKIAKKNVSEKMHEASLLCVKYILFETNVMFINLKYNIIFMERKKIEDNENEFVLAAILTWLTIGTKKYATLRQICSFFKITQQEFYEVANRYNIVI